MKTTFITLVLLLFSAMMFSQSYIYTRTQRERIASEKIKVNDDETTYQLYNNTDGEVYSIPNNEISLIAYENGKVRFFESVENAEKRNDYNPNFMTFHLLDMVVNNFTLSYERIISKGKIGIEIPVSFGYDEDLSGFDDLRNTFYTGVTLNFYPTGQGKVRYFLGPSIQVGQGYFNDGYYDYQSNYVTENIDTYVFRILINNGVMFTPINALSIKLSAAIGIRYTEKLKYEDDEQINTVGAANVSLSYRF